MLRSPEQSREPALSYLHKLHAMPDAVVAALLERVRTAGRTREPGDPALRALTAAAFGCLVAAQQAWLESPAGDPFAPYLDRAMETLTPTC